jgi:hypothetical protein
LLLAGQPSGSTIVVTDPNGGDTGTGSWNYAESQAFTPGSGMNTIELKTNVSLMTDALIVLGGGFNVTVESAPGSTYGFTFASGAGLQYEDTSGTSTLNFTGVNFTGVSGTAGLLFEGAGMTASVSSAQITGISGNGTAITANTNATVTVASDTFSTDDSAFDVVGGSTGTVTSDTFTGCQNGIFDTGTVNVTSSTFKAAAGIAIADVAALSLNVTGSTFSSLSGLTGSNLGCAIDAFDSRLATGSSLVVNTSTFSGNTGEYPLAINDTDFAKQVLVENSSFTGNTQGDIYLDGGADGTTQADVAFVNDWEGNSTSSQPNFYGVGTAVEFLGCMWSGENDGSSPVVSMNPSPSFPGYDDFIYSTLIGNTSDGPAIDMDQRVGDWGVLWYSTIGGNTNTSTTGSYYNTGTVQFQQPATLQGADPFDFTAYSTIVWNTVKSGYGGAEAAEMPVGNYLNIASSVLSMNAAPADPEVFTYEPGATSWTVNSDGYNANDSIGSQSGWKSSDSDAGQNLEFNNGATHDSRNPYLAYTIETSGGWLVGHGDTSGVGQVDAIQQTVKAPVITGAVNELFGSGGKGGNPSALSADSFVPSAPVLTASVMSPTGAMTTMTSMADIAGATIVPGAVTPVVAAIVPPTTTSPVVNLNETASAASADVASFTPTAPVLYAGVMSPSGAMSTVSNSVIAGATVSLDAPTPVVAQSILAALVADGLNSSSPVSTAPAAQTPVIVPVSSTASAVAPVAKTTVASGSLTLKSANVAAARTGFTPISARVSTLARRLPVAQGLAGGSKLAS